MQAVPINYWAVIVAGVASMILGFLWYGPVFGKYWIRLMGWSDQVVEEAKQKGGMWKYYLGALIGAFVMMYVLAHSIVFASAYFEQSGASAGLMAGFWSWLGFVAPVTLGSVLWEGKSWKLWFLNNGYQLVSLLVGGSILGGWM